jgi:hypothetical protein
MNLRMSEEEYAALLKRRDPLQETIAAHGFAPKTNKYRNQPVTVDGVKFDSKKEYARWQQLKMLESAGKVSNLRRQVSFELAPAVTLHGRKKPALRYVADHAYEENGVMVYEDVKSEITRKDPVYRMKIHLLMSVHGVEIREV